ncbi:TrkH family potassium uptake protein [Tropicimonas sp. S265A]|uniref:TrkH family potassium uptake protein n=1 Tax=Tropicimonas sp. S265A TaxID=3415134 RepID=UPI003C7AE833
MHTSLGDGADTLRMRARLPVVALTLAKHAPAFALLYLPPAAWAFLSGHLALGFALSGPAVTALAAFALVLRKPLPDDLRRIEAMVTVALVFLIAAIGAVPAFVELGMPPVDAMFEAMSGITTTGLSVAQAPDEWPFAAHFLRAWMQWIGGLAMATAVLALLLPSGTSTQRLGAVGIDHGDRIASTRMKARQLLGVYLGLTLVMIALAVLVIPGWHEALVLILSGISTGGFAPRSDSLSSYSLLGQSVVMLSCVLGSVSLVTYVLVLKGKFADAWFAGSLRRVLTGIALSCGVYAALLLATTTLTTTEVARRLLDLVSALSTAGYSIGPMPETGVTLTLFLIAMLIGADVGSTGGGLKLERVGTLARALRHALRAPSMPDRAVAPLRQDGDKVSGKAIISLLALLLIYALTLLLVWMHFLVHDHAPAPALFDTISALSTVGLSTGLVGADLPADLKLSLTFAMWLGRLEFIAVLVVLLPKTWMKRI